MATDEGARKAGEGSGLVVGVNAGRRRARRGLWRYVAALGFLALVVAGAAFIATQPLTGQGTISAKQMAADNERPHAIHGFRELKPGEDPDAAGVQP